MINNFLALSLTQNVSAELLTKAGYKLIYNFPYSHDTTTKDLNVIRSACEPFSQVCLGGAAEDDSDNLLLVSCGTCMHVFNPTTLNNPALINGAYWYLTPRYSFGFSDTFHIDQNTCDISHLSDKLKFCGHLDYKFGGWRLGSIYGIFEGKYFKRIYLKL